jgi:uncharacterized protein YecT (DUF1311 family)
MIGERNFLIGSILLLVFTVCSLGQTKPDDCLQQQTQPDLNRCLGDELRAADGELNAVYHQVLSKFALNSDAVSRIKRAQRAWVAFRDAELDSLYPENAVASHSTLDTCRLLYQTELTRERTATLKKMLQRQEGDLCWPGGLLTP